MISEADIDDGRCGPKHALWISEAGGLTQFGAFIETLPSGSQSAIKHWHSAEDELVLMLGGTATLVEGEDETVLKAGDAATFKAGVAVGHFIENRGSADARYLVVGTRAMADTITYPDDDRICHRDRSLPDDLWTDARGQPATSPY
ncbi:MAG: cupin domain-containing protein [Polymorphobacter sp.]